MRVIGMTAFFHRDVGRMAYPELTLVYRDFGETRTVECDADRLFELQLLLA